jgi:hypothetical protein
MRCPRCGSERIGERAERTAQCIASAAGPACGKRFNSWIVLRAVNRAPTGAAPPST